jgi:enoyl-CoA hydratase/carnithine racemase
MATVGKPATLEYFAHPWELGIRRAKELLLTGDSLSVDQAYDIGIVSKVFPEGRLEEDTIAFARRIAAMPSATSLMIKEAVTPIRSFQRPSTSRKQKHANSERGDREQL